MADKLGIDLIWFGVLLGVNMQTSFMHPPFGFALFYFRSVAPSRETVDRVTGRVIAPVTTAQIYWGAIPFVVIQLMMVGVLIAFPDLVLSSLDRGPKVDPTKIRIEVPQTFRANCRNSSSSDMSAAETMPGAPAIVVHSLGHAVAALQAAAEAGVAGPAAQRGRCRAVGRRRVVARGGRGGARFGAGGARGRAARLR